MVIHGNNAHYKLRQSTSLAITIGIRTTLTPTPITQVEETILISGGVQIKLVIRNSKFKPKYHQDFKPKHKIGCNHLLKRRCQWKKCSCNLWKLNNNRCRLKKFPSETWRINWDNLMRVTHLLNLA